MREMTSVGAARGESPTRDAGGRRGKGDRRANACSAGRAAIAAIGAPSRRVLEIMAMGAQFQPGLKVDGGVRCYFTADSNSPARRGFC